MMETPRDPAASRYEHAAHGLRRSDLDPDPIKQFSNWFTAAIEAGIRDVNAMSLATTSPDAKPSVRIVLLKGFDQDGFIFFTNYESEKGKQLEENPYAALAFYWIEVDRQIRISGKAEKTSREESQTYFHSRPVGSQLSAWASRQSQVLDGRREHDTSWRRRSGWRDSSRCWTRIDCGMSNARWMPARRSKVDARISFARPVCHSHSRPSLEGWEAR